MPARSSFAGQTYAALSTALADRLGIGTIHQELSLFGNLTVAENIHLPHLPQRAGLRRPQGDARQRAARCCRSCSGTAIDPGAEVETLSLGERQMVEIAKSIHRSSSLLILDEPTTCLSLPERQRLFEVVRRLAGRGFGIIYITHFMEEVYELADRIVVLRDGAVVGDGTPAEIPLASLARLMVGHDVERARGRRRRGGRGAARASRLEDLSDGVAGARRRLRPAWRRDPGARRAWSAPAAARSPSCSSGCAAARAR